MTFKAKLLHFYFILMLSFTTSVHTAYGACLGMRLAPRIDLTSKSSCVVEAYIKSQISHPADLVQPQEESPAPADRRIKIIDNWNKDVIRNSKPAELPK